MRSAPAGSMPRFSSSIKFAPGKFVDHSPIGERTWPWVRPALTRKQLMFQMHRDRHNRLRIEVAERQGFEPWNTREDVTGIPVQRLRPLGHLSVSNNLGAVFGAGLRPARYYAPPCAPPLRGRCRDSRHRSNLLPANLSTTRPSLRDLTSQMSYRWLWSRATRIPCCPGREGYTPGDRSGKRDSGGL